MIMSIDQSLNSSGVMIWDGEAFLAWYLIKPEDKEAEAIIKIRNVLAELRRLIHRHDVREVVVESLPYGVNSTSSRPLAALYYMIHNLCLDMDVKFSEAIITQVKKFATGKGNAKKPDMILAAIEAAPELFEEIANANIKKTTGLADLADAYFIGGYYWSIR